MNKREARYREIFERNRKQDLSSFSISELIIRSKQQDWLYMAIWERFGNWVNNPLH